VATGTCEGILVGTCGEVRHVRGGAARAESYEVARKAHRIAGVCQGGSGVRRQRWICRCVFVFGKSNRFCVRTKTGDQGWILK
jgi:hypothetical protein